MNTPSTDNIRTTVATSYPWLYSQFTEAGLPPEKVFVRTNVEEGVANAVLVIDDRVFEATVNVQPIDGSTPAVIQALSNFIAAEPFRRTATKRKNNPLVAKVVDGEGTLFSATIIFKKHGRYYIGYGNGGCAGCAYGRAKKDAKVLTHWPVKGVWEK